MNKIYIAIAIIVIIVIAIFYYWHFERFIQYESRYNVLRRYDNHPEAGAYLKRVNRDIIHLHKHLRDKYHIYWNDKKPEDLASKIGVTVSSLERRRAAIKNVLQRYNPEVLYETNPRNLMGETSSTIDKGRKMYFCLRAREKPEELVPYDVLQYVVLHEISHVAADVWGHPPEFWQIFKFILTEAVEAGIHEPVDYEKNPVPYCGMLINEHTYLAPYIESI